MWFIPLSLLKSPFGEVYTQRKTITNPSVSEMVNWTHKDDVYNQPLRADIMGIDVLIWVCPKIGHLNGETYEKPPGFGGTPPSIGASTEVLKRLSAGLLHRMMVVLPSFAMRPQLVKMWWIKPQPFAALFMVNPAILRIMTSSSCKWGQQESITYNI